MSQITTQKVRSQEAMKKNEKCKRSVKYKIVSRFQNNNNILSTQYILATIISTDGEGNGTLLQYSCLENPMGGGAW